MKPQDFDPFRNRLARDIRNNLSKSFLQALAVKDRAIFQTCGSEYLQQYPEPVYASYVKARLEKYAAALAGMEQRQSEGVLQQAAILWDLGLYFEMHELLEPEWKTAGGERRRALQGLIRAAGMKIHAENNNYKAAVSMGTKALEALVRFGAELTGFAGYGAVLEEIRKTLGTARRHYPG